MSYSSCLHLVLDLDPVGRVGRGQRLGVQRHEVRAGARLRRPVALVVRGVRQRALLHLVQVAARAPEVDRERQLEVLVAVVVGVVDHVDLDPRGLRPGSRRRSPPRPCRTRRSWCAGRRSGSLAGRLEQRLGPADVLRRAAAGVVVAGVEGRVEVVADEPVPGQRPARSSRAGRRSAASPGGPGRRRTAACRSPCTAEASRRSWRPAPAMPRPAPPSPARAAGRSSRRSGRRAARSPGRSSH